MQNKWDHAEAARIVSEYGLTSGKDVAECLYLSRLIGAEPDLVLHGGGNTSVKSVVRSIFGESCTALFVKASGHDLGRISPDGFAPLDLERMLKFRQVQTITQDEMLRQMRLSLFDSNAPDPSVEGFLHAFIPSKFILHTHPAAILGLTNQDNSEQILREVLGPSIGTVRYIRAGFGLAHEAAKIFESDKNLAGIVLLQHGLITWGETAEEAYASTIRIVSQAENYWNVAAQPITETSTSLEDAWRNYVSIAPILRGALAEQTENRDHPFRRFILTPCIERDILEILDHPDARNLLVSAPLTPDHLIRTKALPLFLRNPQYQEPAKFKEQVGAAIRKYADEYNDYFDRHANLLEPGARRADAIPRVVLLPGIGAVTAGVNERAALIARDISAQSLAMKRLFALKGKRYRGIAEDHLFEMEYLLMQQAKLSSEEGLLQRQVAMVTGAAGAIGMGITEALLQEGCHVAITDLAGPNLEQIAEGFSQRYPHQVLAATMDVTDPTSVKSAFETVIRRWGGIDLFIVNAGLAMVSSLSEMDLERFRLLERVNVEGALLVLREAAGLFEKQGTGGDVVMISTKNVFAPGAKFGAYSATKAAAHQLARIASLEFAELGVRVNMVAPDAVFSHGKIKSGLWAEVGPDRMKARGLNEAELEEFYRKRNLLKATVTAEHVGRAVLFFATRQTPTTGATLPVDGGLPDSTPR